METLSESHERYPIATHGECHSEISEIRCGAAAPAEI